MIKHRIKLKNFLKVPRLPKVFLVTPFVLFAGVVLMIRSQTVNQAQIPEFLYFQKGTLPIIISIPHDGRLEKDGLPERTNLKSLQNFSNKRDQNTTLIGLSISENMEKLTGKKPYILVNLLHRKYMDPNRVPDEAYEHPMAADFYNQYDSALKEAIEEIKRKYQKGILLDLHGQTEYSDDVYIVTLNGKTMEAPLEKNIRQTLQDKKYKVASQSGEELAIPGSIIDRHGRHISGIDAVEVEIHRKIRYDPALREELAKVLAEAVKEQILANE